MPILTIKGSEWSWHFRWYPISSHFSTSSGRVSECIDYDWYHRHNHVLKFYKLSGTIQVIFCFHILILTTREAKSTKGKFIFLLINTTSGILAKIWWSVRISKSLRISHPVVPSSFLLVCSICTLCYYLFHLCIQIICTSYSVA